MIMTKIVCNSSPIIALSMINQLHLIWELFDEVIIPNEVYHEFTHGNQYKTIGIDELEHAIREEKILLYKVHQIELVEELYGRLHKGELEVIIAAKELNISRVIIDDRSARKFAETLMLKTIGVVGILIAAKKIGLLPEIKPYLDQLITNGYRISKNIYNDTLLLVNET